MIFFTVSTCEQDALEDAADVTNYTTLESAEIALKTAPRTCKIYKVSVERVSEY